MYCVVSGSIRHIFQGSALMLLGNIVDLKSPMVNVYPFSIFSKLMPCIEY